MLKETDRIIKFNKEGTKFSSVEEYYPEDASNDILGSIHNQIQMFECNYNASPNLILISRELEILLDIQTKLHQRQAAEFGDKIVRVNIIFGIPCIVSEALHNLDFEVR